MKSTMLRWWLMAVASCCSVLAAPAPTAIDETFNRLYNFDFQGAHKILDGYIAAHPDEPLPYSVRAAANLFYELDRLGILEGEFLADDKQIIDKKKLRPDPVVRENFLAALNAAETRADRVLASHPDDQNALFARCISQGVATDYMALVEKHQMMSLSSAKRSNSYAQRLLKVDPKFYDAYLTAGFSEYLLGSLPFFMRWFVHFDNVDGSKQRGKENLMLVAEQGRYLKAFAKILLSIIYLREKNPQESRRFLVELEHDYPANPLIRNEMVKLDAMIGAGPSCCGDPAPAARP
jgi:hypothetical protein